MTELQKMLGGHLYNPGDHELSAMRALAHRLCQQYNLLFETDIAGRNAILAQLLPDCGENSSLQGPIYFDYGIHTHIGNCFYANFNLTVLDCAPVTIGNHVFVGPNVCIATPVHPLRYQERNMRQRADGTLFNNEYAKPIVIGNNCWIASNVTINGGVHIGDGCVIGSGSVVTRDIPSNTFSAGSPCRVIRDITDADSISQLDAESH